jgi:radical S-adenosyl methionine domain-containing protein 2
MFPKKVNFMITGKCNNNCKYCYAEHNGEDLDFDRLKKAFLILKYNGVSKITICGGEPTSRSDFNKIINFLIKNKFKIFLDTNGDFFNKYKSIITKNVSVIGLPIDFINKSYRGKNNLKNIRSILEHYKNINKNPKIKIGTVVTKENYKHLNQIGDLIKDYKVDKWKIYQFTATGGNAKKNKKLLNITLKQFYNSIKDLKSRYSSYFNIEISSKKERSGSYFLIKPDGTIFTPIMDENIQKEIIVGNIFEKDIVGKWNLHTKNINLIN